MSTFSLYIIAITSLVLILTVESAYYVYTYDDGNGDTEHCCMVRVRDRFCLATPITRSLIQVNKQCFRFHEHKHRRFSAKKRNNQYLDKILHRLNVQTSQEIGDKVLLELQTPLDKNILENDLVCLSSTHNNINLNKCYVELVDDLNDGDMNNDDNHKPHKRQENRHRHHHSRREKRTDVKIHETVENDADIEAENELRRVEIDQPIRISEGHGLAIRQMYQLIPKNIRPTNRQERQCWSWYRQQTRKIRHNSSKHTKSCVDLNNHREKCIYQLVSKSSNNTETNIKEQEQYTTVTVPIGSKLFCENQSGYNRLLGTHHRGVICFQANNQVIIEHRFTDIAGLSDMHKNNDVLQFIVHNNKLKAEFEDDCNEKTILTEVTEPEKKHKPSDKA